MALTSMRFAFDARLQQVSENNPTMKRDERGDPVATVQSALVDLGYKMPVTTHNGRRHPDGIFGPETEGVVRHYQRDKRLDADGIVGRHTIAALDDDMSTDEASLVSSSGFAGPLLGNVIKAPASKKKINFVIVTETSGSFFDWAKNIKKTLGSIGADLVEIPNGSTAATVTSRLKLAAQKAGPRGILVMSVGHGAIINTLSDEEGFFDLGPAGSFRLGGRNAMLPGDPPPPKPEKPHPVRTSAFYDFRTPNSTQKSGFLPSRKDEDEASSAPTARVRLNNFKQYMDISDTFKKTGLACVVLLTCKVGAASGFIKRVRQQWGTPIVGYNRRVMAQEQDSGRTRVFLEGDAPGAGTNIAFGEFFVPMGPGMVAFP
jgi:peptidoglycan hydrolase-like protein with peptidoglycan-binding domain